MCRSVEFHLPRDPLSVRLGRHCVIDTLVGWGLSGEDRLVQDAAAATSELVANAVRFCSRLLRLEATAHRDMLEVAVSDDSPLPPVPRPPTPDGLDGRGLRIIENVSTEWGYQRLDDRVKRVWCRLAVTEGSPLGIDCSR